MYGDPESTPVKISTWATKPVVQRSEEGLSLSKEWVPDNEYTHRSLFVLRFRHRLKVPIASKGASCFLSILSGGGSAPQESDSAVARGVQNSVRRGDHNLAGLPLDGADGTERDATAVGQRPSAVPSQNPDNKVRPGRCIRLRQRSIDASFSTLRADRRQGLSSCSCVSTSFRLLKATAFWLGNSALV